MGCSAIKKKSIFVLFVLIILSDRLTVTYSRITYFLLFLYQLDELLHMDFRNTIEEIKEQYFMEILSAVLVILEEGRRTGRNVERKTLIFVNFDYESSENGKKKIVFLFLSASK
jgi:hypothetical protein